MSNLGVRNNNWLNIRYNPANDWQGQTGGDDNNYAIFDDPVSGLRAADIVLKNYGAKHGIDNLNEAIFRFAPPEDNNPTPAYAKFVADKMGINPDDKIDLSDPDVRERMISAMVQFETPDATSLYSPALMSQARGLSNTSTNKPATEEDAIAKFFGPQIKSAGDTAAQDWVAQFVNAPAPKAPVPTTQAVNQAAYNTGTTSTDAALMGDIYSMGATGGVTADNVDQVASTPIGPTGTTDLITTFRRGMAQGAEQTLSDFAYFGAAIDALQGDEAELADSIENARISEEFAGIPLAGMETFGEFLDSPTVGGFLDQVSAGTGQLVPSVVSSISGAGVGSLAMLFGKEALQGVSKRAVKNIVQDSVEATAKKQATPDQQKIAQAAYEALQEAHVISRDRFLRNRLMKRGALGGAGASEFAPLTGSNVGEALESGRELDRANALRAMGVAVPQAAIGVLGEAGLVSLIRNQAAKKSTGPDSVMGRLATSFGGQFVKGGALEGTAELAQEELAIRNRMSMDDTFTDADANLRRLNAGFVGFFGAGSLAGSTGLARQTLAEVGNSNIVGAGAQVVEKAANMVDSIKETMTRAQTTAETADVDPDQTSQESEQDINAQLRAMLNKSSSKEAVWIAGTEPDSRYATRTTPRAITINGEVAYAAYVPGRGTIISQDIDVVRNVVKGQASDSVLASALGYSNAKTGQETHVYRVYDEDGGIVSEEAVTLDPEAVKAAKSAAENIMPDGGRVEFMSIEEAMADRARRADPDIRFMEDEDADIMEQDQDTNEQVGDNEFESEVRVHTFVKNGKVFENYQGVDGDNTFEGIDEARENYKSMFGETDFSNPLNARMSKSLLNTATKLQQANPDQVVTVRPNADGTFRIEIETTPETQMVRFRDGKGNEQELSILQFLTRSLNKAAQSLPKFRTVNVKAPDREKAVAVNPVDLMNSGRRIVESNDPASGFMGGGAFQSSQQGILAMLAELQMRGYEVDIQGVPLSDIMEALNSGKDLDDAYGNIVLAFDSGGKPIRLKSLLKNYVPGKPDQRPTQFIRNLKLLGQPFVIKLGRKLARTQSIFVDESDMRKIRPPKAKTQALYEAYIKEITKLARQDLDFIIGQLTPQERTDLKVNELTEEDLVEVTPNSPVQQSQRLVTDDFGNDVRVVETYGQQQESGGLAGISGDEKPSELIEKLRALPEDEIVRIGESLVEQGLYELPEVEKPTERRDLTPNQGPFDSFDERRSSPNPTPLEAGRSGPFDNVELEKDPETENSPLARAHLQQITRLLTKPEAGTRVRDNIRRIQVIDVFPEPRLMTREEAQVLEQEQGDPLEPYDMAENNARTEDGIPLTTLNIEDERNVNSTQNRPLGRAPTTGPESERKPKPKLNLVGAVTFPFEGVSETVSALTRRLSRKIKLQTPIAVIGLKGFQAATRDQIAALIPAKQKKTANGKIAMKALETLDLTDKKAVGAFIRKAEKDGLLDKSYAAQVRKVKSDAVLGHSAVRRAAYEALAPITNSTLVAEKLANHFVDSFSKPNRKGFFKGFEGGGVVMVNDLHVTNEAAQAMAAAHEIGHAVFREELNGTLQNPAILGRLSERFIRDRAKKGATKQYEGKNGFEEWYADQIAAWIKKDMTKDKRGAKNAVDSHFKRVANRFKQLWRDVKNSAIFRRTNTVAPEFSTYMDSVMETREGTREVVANPIYDDDGNMVGSASAMGAAQPTTEQTQEQRDELARQGAQTARRRKQAKKNFTPRDEDGLLAAIAARGGISRESVERDGLRDYYRERVGSKFVFTNNGLSIDDMFTALQEAGWYNQNPEGAPNTQGANDLLSDLVDALQQGQENPFYTPLKSDLDPRFEERMEAEYQAATGGGQGGGTPPPPPPNTDGMPEPDEPPFEQKAFVKAIKEQINIETGAAAREAEFRKFMENIGRDFLNDNPWATQILGIIRTADGMLRMVGGDELADLFYVRSFDRSGMGFAQARQLARDKWRAGLFEVLGKDWTTDEVQDALKEAQSSTPTGELKNPKAVAIRNYLQRMHEDYIAPSNSEIDFRENYFPVLLELAEIAADPDTFIEMVVEANNAAGVETDMKALKKSVNRLVKYQAVVDQGGTPESEDILDPGAVAEASLELTKNVDRGLLRDTGYLMDPEVALMKYVDNVTKRVEWNRAMKGPNGEDKLGAFLEEMTPREREVAQSVINAYVGNVTHLSPFWRKTNSYLATMNLVTLLPFATLASIPDFAGSIVQTREFKGFGMAAKEIVNQIQNREQAKRLANDIGVVMPEAAANAWMSQADSDMLDPTARQATDKFFQWTGLQFLTTLSREFSTGMGKQFLIEHAYHPTERSERYLRQMGVTAEQVRAWNEGDQSFTTEEGEAVRAALQRFVESSVLRPNAGERPIWASDPRFALVWQLKSFIYAFNKVILDGVMREAHTRTFEGKGFVAAMGPLMVLTMAAFMPLAALGLELREYAKVGLSFALPGIDGSFRYLRSDQMDYGTYFLELFSRAGLDGPLGMLTMAQRSGDWGGSALATLLGPTAELVDKTLRDGPLDGAWTRMNSPQEQAGVILGVGAIARTVL